jgi:spore cortex biosynthesis protein YabQ
MFVRAAQAEVFLATVYAGLAAGVAYDLLRLMRLFLRTGKLVTALFDIVFWVLAAGMVAIAAALSGEEGLRFYLILGTLCGMLIWALGFRRLVLLLERTILNLSVKKKGGKTQQNGE